MSLLVPLRHRSQSRDQSWVATPATKVRPGSVIQDSLGSSMTVHRVHPGASQSTLVFTSRASNVIVAATTDLIFVLR